MNNHSLNEHFDFNPKNCKNSGSTHRKDIPVLSEKFLIQFFSDCGN